MLRTRLLLLGFIVGAFLLTAAPALAAPAAIAGCSQYYTVRPGDNLFRIGLRFGTNYYSLMQMNGIGNANFIFVGQVLCVHGGSYTAPGGYSSPSGAPLKHGDPGYIGYATPRGFEYCVKAGDTLSSIAARYGWSTSYLAAVNGLSNPNLIYVEVYLLIPNHR